MPFSSSQPHWSARKPIRKAADLRPGHLVNKRNSGQIWPRVGIHLGNVGLWFRKLAPSQPQISLAYLPPTPRQTRSALAGAAVLLLGFAVLAPFAAKPLPQVNGFIPALDAIIFVTDLITASILFAHFSITGSRALLALACGYLFSAVMVVAHGLSFPGDFSPTGNLGGSSQTTFGFI